MGSVLVTGYKGYLGTKVVETLTNNNITDIVGVDLVEGCDIRDYDQLKVVFENHNIKTVVHTAALKDIPKSFKCPNDYYQTNVTGTKNLLDLSVEYNIEKFINISSYTIYGKCFYPVGEGYKESQQHRPLNPYSISKSMADTMVTGYNSTYNLHTINLRLHALYGNGNYNEPPAINKFVDMVKNEKTITLYNNGEQMIDYLHVDDAAEVIFKIIQHPYYIGGESFNVCSHDYESLNEIVQLIGKLTNKDPKIQYFVNNEPGRSNHVLSSSCKLENTIDFSPMSLRSGIIKML